MTHELDAQHKGPSMAATFFATPFLIAIALSLAAITWALVRSIFADGLLPRAPANPSIFFYLLFSYLFFGGSLAAFYALTHWPFIPLLRRLQDKPLKQNLIAVAAITLYGAVVMVVAWTMLQGWNTLNDVYRNQAPAGAALSLVLTIAILLAARWRAWQYDRRTGAN